MQEERIKLALVGLGRWGKRVAAALQKESDLLAYLLPTNEENRAWAAEHLTAKPTDFEGICAGDALGVVVATPIATHAACARRLLEAGKHVLVEKPAAATSAEARDLARLAADRGLLLATGYLLLYHPVYQELKRRLTKPIRSVECVWEKYGTFEEPIDLNLLTHHLSIAVDLLGAPVRGSMRKLSGVESPWDALTARLEYPEAEFVSRIDRASASRTHVIRVELADGTVLEWDGSVLREGAPGQEPRPVFESSEEPLRLELRAFVHAISTGATLPTGGDFGARVLEVHERLATDSQ